MVTKKHSSTPDRTSDPESKYQTIGSHPENSGSESDSSLDRMQHIIINFFSILMFVVIIMAFVATFIDYNDNLDIKHGFKGIVEYRYNREVISLRGKIHEVWMSQDIVGT